MNLYIPGGSALHRLHPAARLASFLVLCTVGVLLTRPPLLLGLLILCLILAAVSGSLPNIRKAAPLLAVFFVVTVAIWAVLRGGGEPILEWRFLSVSQESLIYAVATGIRLLTLTVLGFTYLTVTSVEDFGSGLESLGIPFRVSFALSLSFRLLPLFFTTIETVVLAQKSRGLDLSSRRVDRRLMGYVPLFVPIISHGLRDADGLAMALECRGFGSGPRATADERGWTARDTVAILTASTLLALAAAGRVAGLA